jgi:uncharacterized protein
MLALSLTDYILLVRTLGRLIYTNHTPAIMSIRTVRYGSMDLDNPVALIGFPSAGLVSSIISNFYVAQLSMPVIASMSGPNMPPYCFIVGNQAYPPVRFYGRKGKGKNSRDVIICLSEYAPKPEEAYELAREIITFLRRMGVVDVICFEGVPKFSGEEFMMVCGSGPGCAPMMKKSKLPVMDTGMIRGLTGILMYEGEPAGMNVISVLCPANQSVPDPGSAVGFIEPISKMVPGLKVDPKPLLEEADLIKKKMDEQQQPSTKDFDSQLYG